MRLNRIMFIPQTKYHLNGTVSVENKDGNPFMPQVKHGIHLASLHRT